MSLSVQSLKQSLIEVSEKENERLRHRTPKQILQDRMNALEQELAQCKAQMAEEFHEPEPVPPEDLVIQKLQERIELLEKKQEQFNLLESFVLNYIRLESTKSPGGNDYRAHQNHIHINMNIRSTIEEYRDKRQLLNQRKYKFKTKSLDWSHYFYPQKWVTQYSIQIQCSIKNYCLDISKVESTGPDGFGNCSNRSEQPLGKIQFKEFGLNQEKDKEYIFIFSFTNEKVSVECNEKKESFLLGNLVDNTKGIDIKHIYNTSESLEEIFE